MQISSKMIDSVQVTTVSVERIDAAVAIAFKDKMRVETDNDEPRVILDFAQVDFVDSSGLGAIVAAMKQMGPGRKLDLCGLTPNVESVFRLTRMDTVFKIYPTLQDALAGEAA